MTTPTLHELPQALPDLDWITDASRVARLSQDFNWYSPILKRQLEGKTAELAVRPRTEDEIRRVVAACARARIPITVRGSVGRAQSGIRLADFDRAALPQGQELRWLPSTFRTATLGGLYGGGFGGAGSVTWGPVAAVGNVLGLRVMTVEPEPQVLELRAPEALLLHHTYGTNGIVLELEVALAPAQPWMEAIATFPTLAAGVGFASALAKAPGIAKKEVCYFSADVCRYMAHLQDFLPNGRHAVLMMLDEGSEVGMRELLARFDGALSYRRSAEEVQRTQKTLLESTWNHTTLHAMKVDRTLTYLQTAFDPARHVAQVQAMDELLGEEVLMHLEFLRTKEGELTCSGLPLVRYRSDERLNELIALHRANGVTVNNPHVYIVEEGKQAHLNPAVVETKARFDPLGLLNPGKLRAWAQREAAGAVAAATPSAATPC